MAFVKRRSLSRNLSVKNYSFVFGREDVFMSAIIRFWTDLSAVIGFSPSGCSARCDEFCVDDVLDDQLFVRSALIDLAVCSAFRIVFGRLAIMVTVFSCVSASIISAYFAWRQGYG